MATAGERKPRVKSVIEMPVAAEAAALPIVSAAEPAADDSPVESPVSDLPMAAPPAADLIADANPSVLDPAVEQEPTPATPSAAAAPEPTQKEIAMPETYTTAADALKNGADAMQSSMHTASENAMASGKATFEQVASKSREAIETGMKHADEMAGMARGNVEAMLASSRAAASGIEAIAREVADFSRKAFDETTAAARAMATVKTPNELLQLQNDFAKTQFDAAVAEMSKLSETMVKLMGEVFEPMQARATVATDKFKSMVSGQ